MAKMSVKRALLRLHIFIFLHNIHFLFAFSHTPPQVIVVVVSFIVVYASSKKVVKKPLEKFIYDASHSREVGGLVGDYHRMEIELLGRAL